MAQGDKTQGDKAKPSKRSGDAGAEAKHMTDLNVYRTVAVSDTFLSACSFYAANTTKDDLPAYATLGFLNVAIASAFGVARFGFAPKIFTPGNNFFASLSRLVGIPFIGLGFALSRNLLDQDMAIKAATVLAGGFILSRFMSEERNDAYGTLIAAAGLAGIVLSQREGQQTFRVTPGDLGVLLFVIGAVVIGPDRQKTLLGVRRENWFHYFLGAAMLCLAEAS